jgi:hypothetical protein
MPLIEIAAEKSVSREQLRTFHLTGRGLNALLPAGTLRPASLERLELPRSEQNYPIFVAGSEPAQPFYRLLQALAPALGDHLELIAGAFGEQIGPGSCVPLASVLDKALAAVRARLDPVTAETECTVLRKALPANGWLIAFGEEALVALSCSFLESARNQARLSFARELKQYGLRLQEQLAADERKSASSSDRLAASLGARAGEYFDSSALADALRRRPNPTLAMDQDRRAQCEAALATIQKAIHDLDRLPAVILIHSGKAPNVPAHVAVQCREAADACDCALELCRRQLSDFVPVWKAMRIARLEVESAYNPAVHREVLDAFDQSMAHPTEIAALPAIVVHETAERIEQSLASFSRLLQSGLPIHVLIACKSIASGSLGCLPLAYQDAFAFHSSIAAPDHLLRGLAEMAQKLRPATAIVATGGLWKPAALLPLTGACPLYRYDPELGQSWFQRFALQTDLIDDQLTFAHAAALLPEFRNHFRILPGIGDPVTDLAEYPDHRQPHAFPFLFVTDEKGNQRRALLTRELVNLCSAARERQRILLELAAPKAAKETAVLKDPDAENRARLEGAKQAIHRVIAMLTA